jgi:beta-mannosidase
VGNADLGEYADALTDRFRMREYYLTFTLEQGNEVLASGSKLFVLPKTFLFQRPEIRTEITETAEHFAVTLSADAYVMAVCLDGRTMDIDFSDNWFDLHGGMPVTVTIPKTEGLTVEKLREELTVRGT